MTNAAEFLVRAFRRSDSGALGALWGRVFPDDPPWNAPEVMIENKLRVQPELLLVGELGGTIVGAVIAGFDGVRGWIYHLAVAPEHRRRGLATRLVRSAEQGLQALGCPKVNLQVRGTNQEVVAFYRALGYQVEERVSMGRRLEGAERPAGGAMMDVLEKWASYDCADYVQSPLAERGWWDEAAQCWYIEPSERVHEDPARDFLVIGRPGVDGIEWGYRKGRQGIWAHYPIEDDFVLIADSAADLRDGYASGRITV